MPDDVVAGVRDNVRLRPLARGRVEDGDDGGGLVGGVVAVAAAEDEVVLAELDVDGAGELHRGRDNGSEGEEFAEGVGLF